MNTLTHVPGTRNVSMWVTDTPANVLTVIPDLPAAIRSRGKMLSQYTQINFFFYGNE